MPRALPVMDRRGVGGDGGTEEGDDEVARFDSGTGNDGLHGILGDILADDMPTMVETAATVTDGKYPVSNCI